MFGAIAGDIIGSVHEGVPCRDPGFPLFCDDSRFTDDTVLTVATAHALLDGEDFSAAYRRYGRRFPNAGYGARFHEWIFASTAQPYGSWGNGSAMRVSPIGWAFGTLARVMDSAAESAAVTHNHPEGVKGAQAVAAAIYWARKGVSKGEMRAGLAARFGYDLDRTAVEIRKDLRFDVSCQGSVPEALICFLDSTDFEDAVRLAVLLGGDADTQACIAGAVAEAYYGGVPREIVRETRKRLPPGFQETLDRFYATHQVRMDFATRCRCCRKAGDCRLSLNAAVSLHSFPPHGS